MRSSMLPRAVMMTIGADMPAARRVRIAARPSPSGKPEIDDDQVIVDRSGAAGELRRAGDDVEIAAMVSSWDINQLHSKITEATKTGPKTEIGSADYTAPKVSRVKLRRFWFESERRSPVF